MRTLRTREGVAGVRRHLRRQISLTAGFRPSRQDFRSLDRGCGLAGVTVPGARLCLEQTRDRHTATGAVALLRQSPPGDLVPVAAGETLAGAIRTLAPLVICDSFVIL